jgi:tRNA(Arg) A34 adenosine deaminase TadA
MTTGSFTMTLPLWVGAFLGEEQRICRSREERMRIAVSLSRLNVAHGTGGPFGAAVFEAESGRLITPGVNLVVSGRCSILHAEIVAIILAQRVFGTFDLGATGIPACELVTSVEPCAMCLGAVPWSGVRRLVCGARGEDAEAIGFDEGAKPYGWVGELERRGIEVVRDCCRDEADAVLREYAGTGGPIYNARGGSG